MMVVIGENRNTTGYGKKPLPVPVAIATLLILNKKINNGWC